MEAFFKEIFSYHHHFNQKLIDQVEQYQEQIPEKSIQLLCHILNAHQIWNARILHLPPFAVNDRYPFDKCRSIDTENHLNTDKILAAYDLETPIKYKNTKGNEYSNKLKDILFHVANHSTHHRAQIIASIRQAGIEPIVTDYIFFKR